jgi:hypothetical protein
MAKLKAEDYGSFDPDELDVEWSDNDDYEPYDGELPKSNILLRGYCKKMWWTFSSNDNAMIKVLWVAEGNTGKTEEFNGLPIWDQIVFTPKASFRYGPFLQVLGITLRDVFKKMDVAEEDDNVGCPINWIAKMVPGEDARIGVITKREKYEGESRVKVGKFVEDPELDDEEEEEEEAPVPTRTRGAKTPEQRRLAVHHGGRRKPDPEPEEVEEEVEEAEEDVEEEDEAPPPKPVRKPASRGTAAAKKPAAKPATRTTRRKPADDDDEAPF